MSGLPKDNEGLLRHAADATAPAFARSAVAKLGERGLVPLVAALMALALAGKLGHVINHDVAWYIHSAMAFLDGGRLYEEVFFDVNPPLMLYLSVPGAALARLTGLFPVHAFVLTVAALITFSLWLSWRVLSDAPTRCRHASLVVSSLVLAILPAGDFGQRSHLLVCLALPHLLLVARRLRDEKPACGLMLAVVVGATAGIGFAIKPHYLLAPAALEMMVLWRTCRLRSLLRPETLTIAAVLALYVAAVLVFTPAYLTRVVPYALEVYERGYRNGLAFVLARPETFLVPAAVLLHWRFRRALTPWHIALADVLVLSAVALFAVYLMQMKGWNYHLYPTTAMLVMLVGIVIATSSAILLPLRMVALAVALALVARTLIMADHRYPLMSGLTPYIRAHGADAIYVFGSNVWAGFPMTVYAEVEWASRFPALWLLPELERRRRAATPDADLDALEEIDRFTTEAVIADLSTRAPEVVFVDARPRKPYYGDTDFDFIAHFSADPTLRRPMGTLRADRRGARLRGVSPSNRQGLRYN